jgi:DNA-binding beta-propeller fold protein YncE
MTARGWRRLRRWPWRPLCIVLAWALLITTAAIDTHRFLYGSTSVLPIGDSPDALVVSPDGRTIYLASWSDNIITPVSAATGKAGQRIVIRGGAPGANIGDGLAITPDGRTLFATVTDRMGQGARPLARIDLRTGKETGQISLPGGVSSFVMSRDGKTLYAETGDGELIAVNAATGRPEREFAVSSRPLGQAMMLTPDGRTLYITTLSDDLDPIGAVVPVDLRTGAVGLDISVGWDPASLAITPDGRTLYVAIDGLDGEMQVAPNRVKVIDTATGAVRASLPWRVPPLSLAMAPDGRTVWVASISGEHGSTADDTVTPVSTAGNQPGASFHTGGWLNSQDDAPSGLAVSPDGRTLYVAVASGLESFRLSLGDLGRYRGAAFDGAAHRAQPVVGLLHDVRQDRAGAVTGLAVGEFDPVGDHDVL